MTIPVQDPNVHHDERARLSEQSRQVLAAFQASPDGCLRSDQLMEVAQRFGARIHDIRRAGYRIEIVERNHKTGLTVYQLQKEEQRSADPASSAVKQQRKELCALIAKLEAQGATELELARVFPSMGQRLISEAVRACWAYGYISKVAGEVRQNSTVYHIAKAGLEALGQEPATTWHVDQPSPSKATA